MEIIRKYFSVVLFACAVLYPMTIHASTPVPFVMQAPGNVWNETHKEACEEASVLMALLWWKNAEAPSATATARTYLTMRRWQTRTFGYWKDTTIDESVRMLTEWGKVSTDNVTVLKQQDDMKEIISAVKDGAIVIFPAQGKKLRNPYFRPPGPLYHHIVIYGWDEQKKDFITHDPGTRRGAGLRYSHDILFTAWGDWDHEKEIPHARNAIVVRK